MIKNSLPLNIKEFFNTSFEDSGGYAFGFFVAICSLGIFDNTRVEEMYTITRMNDHLEKYLLPKVASLNNEIINKIKTNMLNYLKRRSRI